MDSTKEIHGKTAMLSPQCRRVLNHLQKRGSITASEARGMYAVENLSARIDELRKAGHAITSRKVERINKFAVTVWVARYELK